MNDYVLPIQYRKKEQKRVISYPVAIQNFPVIYKEEEIQKKVFSFLENVFFLSKPYEKENLLVYQKELDEERILAQSIGLWYLEEFVYSVSNDYLLNDEKIRRLEEYLASKEFFISSLFINKGDLCVAKALLFSRVGARQIFAENLHLVRKVLLK